MKIEDQTEDHYATLGVSENISEIDLKKRYHLLAMIYHPDRNPGNKAAEKRFKEISCAYDIVGHKESREIYDRGHKARPTIRPASSTVKNNPPRKQTPPLSPRHNWTQAPDIFDAMYGLGRPITYHSGNPNHRETETNGFHFGNAASGVTGHGSLSRATRNIFNVVNQLAGLFS